MEDSLHLAGDGDEMDVLHDVQKTFGIVITDREAEATLTVGELYDLIETKSPERAEQCLSQIAFYRLRQALQSFGSIGPINPRTPISIVHQLNTDSIRVTWRQLSQRSGLKLPPLETPVRFLRLSSTASRRAYWLMMLVIVALTALAGIMQIKVGVIFLVLFGLPVASAVIQYGLHLLFGDIPRRIGTIGDLAREAAGYSFSEFHESRRACSPQDRWYGLVAILRQISGHKTAIGRDTTFIARG